MATYYFLNTDSDEDWSNSNNWWDAPSGGNDGQTPTSSDDVVILGYLSQITSGAASVANMTIEANVTITATVSGTCTVQNYGYLGDGATINGNVVCSTDGFIGLNDAPAYINGNLTFSNNGSTESGNTTTAADVSGDVILSSNWTGDMYNVTAVNLIITYGNSGTFDLASGGLNLSGDTLYASYPTLYYVGNPTSDWNDLDSWLVSGPWSGLKSYNLPNSNTDVFITASVSANGGGTAECNNMTVESGRIIAIDFTASGTITFDGSSVLGWGYVSCPPVSVSCSHAIFNDTSINGLTTSLNATSVSFNDTSSNTGSVEAGTTYFNDSSTTSGNVSTQNIGNSIVVTYPVNRNTFNTGTIGGNTSYNSYPTFYYNGASNSDWDTLGNWWENSACTTPAAYVPGAADTVYFLMSPYLYSSKYVSSATVGENVNFGPGYSGTLYVAGTITFLNGSVLGSATESGIVEANNAEFYGNSYIYNSNSVMTVSTEAKFYNTSMNSGTVSGSASFYNSSTNAGTVSGDATVHSPNHPISFNNGSVTGTIYYSGYSTRNLYFNGAVNSDWATLGNWWEDSACTIQATYVPVPSVALDNVTLLASVTMNMNSATYPSTVGNLVVDSGTLSISVTCSSAQFNNSSVLASGSEIFIDNVYSSTITFSDLSTNEGIVNGGTPAVVFEDNSSNTGTINSSEVYVYYPVSIPLGGTINAIISYFNYLDYYFDGTNTSGDWNNTGSWFLDSSCTIAAGSVPTETYPGANVILKTSVTSNSGGTPTAYNLLCDRVAYSGPWANTSINNINITINGLATFGDESAADEQQYREEIGSNGDRFAGGKLLSGATITGDAFFKNGATNVGGTVSGTATFTLSAAKAMMIIGNDGTYGSLEFKYGKGVNGSSILGLV